MAFVVFCFLNFQECQSIVLGIFASGQHARKERESMEVLGASLGSVVYHFYPYSVWPQLSQEHFLNMGAWEIYSYCVFRRKEN